MQDNFIAPVRASSTPQFAKVSNMKQGPGVQNQLEEQATVVKKAPSKPRKSQRFTRTVYELTEASVYENVQNQSRAMTLANKEEAKAQELADTADPEGQRADSEEGLVEAMLVRKMQAKTEKGLKDAGNQPRNDSRYVVAKALGNVGAPGDDGCDVNIDRGIEREEEKAALSIHEVA